MKTKLLLTVCFLGLVSPVLAASGGHHEATVWTYAFPFINFVLLVGVLLFFLRKPIKKSFESRANTIKDGIAEAKVYYDDAFRRYEEIECKLKNSDVEGKRLLETLRGSAEQEKRKMVADAEDFAKRLQSDTQNMIQQEMIKAQNLLRAEVVNLAAKAAEENLKKTLTSEDQKRISAEFVSDVKSSVAKGASL